MHALLVDSDASVRPQRAHALTARGWETAAAATPEEALAWLETADELDLLVTEAVFGSGLTGFEVRDAARARFPGVPVLFTTRYDLSGFEAQISGSPVLADSPYETGELIEEVNALLRAPAPPVSGATGPLLPPGTQLGNYEIQDQVDRDSSTETYRALQLGVERLVGLVVLRPALGQQPEQVARFKARERAKAALNHPRIAPLYEAGEEAGYYFYTREVPRGRSLHEITAAGELLSERALAELVYGVAEVMTHITSRDYQHREITDWDIYLDEDLQASMVNIFRPLGDGGIADEARAVRSLFRLLNGRVAGGKAAGLLQSLKQCKQDWDSLHREIVSVRNTLRDHSIQHRIEQEQSEAPENAAQRAIPWWAWFSAGAALVAVALLGALSGNPGRVSHDAAEDAMVVIPAGPFLYQQGEKRSLPAFWISRTEVTLNQYAEFLEAVGAGKTPFDHPDQPADKAGHQPDGWKNLLEAARSGATVSGQKITVDIPVHGVDWWDAYAYSRWRGRRLPTEEEWEKAARGVDGFAYPWGAEWQEGAANLGADYDPKGRQGGKVDGYNVWAPVDRETRDVSPFTAQDMAGNVEEWTEGETRGELWSEHPELPDLRVPVARGGHFADPSGKSVLTDRHFAESASQATPTRGFRTASDRAPTAR